MTNQHIGSISFFLGLNESLHAAPGNNSVIITL
jgi:hypothetical protein